MTPIQPARLKPGVTLETIAARAPRASGAAQGGRRLVRGKALIVWDPKHPGKKLDAIDTDQITPSSDCVSESLATLDERWKAGSFRYLMPGFRERVHAGQNVLVAGDRFAIGSSREMSPAGLKGVAEEAGLEMVIVCGGNMGDIFRRNALNLGLHVVQSQDAVRDARDGDEFTFDVETREIVNVTQDRRYRPLPLTEKEEEIRKGGGIFDMGRREFRESAGRAPRVEFPDATEARTLTLTEQIVWAHRVDREASVRPGATLRLYADLLPASDGTAPFAIHTVNAITGGGTVFPRQAAIASDHFVFTGKEDDRKQTSISEEFARLHSIGRPHYASPGDGIFHFYFPEQGLIVPGGFYPGADSHSRAYGAYGAAGIGIGSTTLGFGWATGYIYMSLAKQRRVEFAGRLQPWVSGKDIVLELLRRWGAQQAQGMGVEFVDALGQLPMTYRNTIANMMAEAEAQNGIFAQDATTDAWYRERGIALPYQKALIGSCTNGSYDDLLGAAMVVRAARESGHARVASGVQFLVFPGSGTVGRRIEEPDARLGGASIAEVFRNAGGEIRQSWCGPCFGQGPDSLRKGERAITSFNRNWQNRMGVGGEGYLASPAVVAASALV